MITGKQYRKSLDDGRAVYFEGQRVNALADHPVLGKAVDLIADGYDRWFDESNQAGANPVLGAAATGGDLAGVLPLLDEADALVNLTYQSIMCLLTASGRSKSQRAEYSERIGAFAARLSEEDLRCALCITDGKGDRGLPPLMQPDPDAYTRVVSRSAEGVVIRGSKLHITAGPLAHEFLVMPTKAMKPGEEDYAICCAVPVGAPGVKVVARTSASQAADQRHHPFSKHGIYPEGFVIFDDVFVPNERIFLDGEVGQAALFAHALGLWERLKALTLMADDADTLVGLAQLVAEANGLTKVAHIREKINDMVIYATLIRAGLLSAVATAKTSDRGIGIPDETFTNVTKFYAADNYSTMVRNLQDIAGGSLVTAPTMADLDNPEVGPLIEKYMATGAQAGGRYRTYLLHAIRDMTADAAGGHTAAIQLHAGGGMYAQRIVARKHYDIEGAKRKARQRVGLPDVTTDPIDF